MCEVDDADDDDFCGKDDYNGHHDATLGYVIYLSFHVRTITMTYR